MYDKGGGGGGRFLELVEVDLIQHELVSTLGLDVVALASKLPRAFRCRPELGFRSITIQISI